ncbi:type II secretion system protein [Mesotoga sp. UBA5847]|uniref:type II secretion system protein n=1 Tax=Mesotoga sp. UBA5847 TaxID=1946859 RepID=UPI0025CCDFC1|nr:type II secretion system protein [Mesotoga sp. UBA5847]
MKNRKRGFSLVELLIVLAVIAALIATITPVALNAIRKSKATQVAQNLKTLASAIENAAYVNGVFRTGEENAGKIRNASNNKPIKLEDLGRDINTKEYAVYYGGASGSYTAVVAFVGEAEIELVDDVLPQATETDSFVTADLVGHTSPFEVEGTEISTDYSGTAIYYRISFDVY